jgi:hypothetical protein
VAAREEPLCVYGSAGGSQVGPMAKVVVELGGEWLWNGHGIFRKVHDSYDETAFYENIPDVLIHLVKTAYFTGNPPYSIPPYSSRCAAVNRVECDRGEVLTAGQVATGAAVPDLVSLCGMRCLLTARLGLQEIQPHSVTI